ncbi:uncharacterized protein LOC116013932 [Ipomoea triloba]|uniref:uncharacterized protein LOC116013932 n=1 Tax=Ipomoea triloba TaxID=35885 RepID=UPI00125E4D75|nr:uncharacterized protein LOC116013932 [Ipomoea triloba]
MGGTDESVSLFSALDPKSLLLSQFSSADHPQFLQLTTEGFLLERGPRYKAYADLRESKLRMKHMKPPVSEEEELILTPPKKQVKFQGSMATPPRRSKGASVLAQSVPDFSYALRKENRKPPAPLPPVMEKSATPPPPGMKSGRFVGGVGSKSLNSGDKRSGGLMSRKSYANLEEFKGLASAARNAINGDNRAGNGRRGGTGKTVLGYRQL